MLGRDVDLVDLRSASTVLRKEVIAGGELLFDAQPMETATFEATVLGAYARASTRRGEAFSTTSGLGDACMVEFDG